MTHFGHRSGNMLWALGVRGGQLARRNYFSVAAGLALVLLCCACAGRPLQGVLVPNAQSADGATRVPILVATTRNRLIADPGEMFGRDRASEVSYAAIAVSIPPDSARKIGEVQWPSARPGDPGRCRGITQSRFSGLSVKRTIGPSRHANSPHPSSREGHYSTAWWSSSFLLSHLILSGS